MHMSTTDPWFWFWNITVFLYFNLKGTLLNKLSPKKKISINPLISVFISLVALYANNHLFNDYNRYLSMTYVKGAIVLPPFPLLFLLADFLGTLLITFIFLSRTGQIFTFWQPVYLVYNLALIYVVNVSFSTIAGHMWLSETKKLMNWDYQCFKDQIAIDMATYYYDRGKLPDKLEDFTSFRKNPINDSDLIYTAGSIMATSIKDGHGNKILVGYKDLMGLEMYSKSPEEFFYTRFFAFNKNLCKGVLTIPERYNKTPSYAQ